MVRVRALKAQRRLRCATAMTLALPGCYSGLYLPGANDDQQETGQPIPGADSQGSADTDDTGDTGGGTDGEPSDGDTDGPTPQCTDNDPISSFDQLAAMTDDLTATDADDRPFIRYFTLTHLHNAGLCQEDLDLYRHGVSKLLNSLSRAPTIVVPVAIDAAETIYKVDLRDYEWDQPMGEFSNKWDALVATSPYAFERFEDEAETLKTFAGTEIPFLLGDAFIELASQAPLYHDLAEIPATLAELEAQLGLSIEDNVLSQDVRRAGVLDSGVSRQNRIIERHDIPLGFGRTLWVSYDFADDSAESQNIFSSPLDFVEAGGEVIFTLPNGMQAYMLTDDAGGRIDVAPDDIVTDPTQEDQNVHNGISCFGCHSGIIPATDEVRDHVLSGLEFDAQTKDTVEAIYPPADELTAIMEADTQRYQEAVAQAGTPIDSTLEPVSEGVARHRFNVTLARAAAELGISEDTLLTQIGGLDPQVGPLANGGSIKRDAWNEVFAQTVCDLHLGRSSACPDALPSSDGTTAGDSDESGGTSGSDGGTGGYE